MFKLSTLLFLSPLVGALTFTTPTNLTSGNSATITWTSDAGDPTEFNLYLFNQVFHDSFGIANSVQTTLGTITLQLPAVPPGDGYTLQGTNVTDINQSFGTSQSFSIGATISTSASSSSTPSSAATSGSASASITSSGSVITHISGSSSGSSGSTGSTQASGTSSSTSATPSTFNGNGAVSNNIDSWLAMIVAAVAGGVFAL